MPPATLRAAGRPDARLLHACRCCSATGAEPGQRDLRMTNDRHYYRDGTDQLWRVSPGDAPARTPRPTVGAPADLGDGHRQPGRHRRRLPEVFLTSQGDNKLQTLADGPDSADLRGHRAATRRHRPSALRRRGRAPVDRVARRVRRTSTTTAFIDLFVSKGNVEAEPGYATRDPSNLLLGQADGTFVEGAEARRDRQLRPRTRRRARRPQPRRPARPRGRQPREPVTVWRNAGARRRRAPGGDGPLGRRATPPAGAQRRRDRRVGGGAHRRPNVDHEVTVGGGHASGQLGWIHLGLGEADQADVRVQWPDGEIGPWMTLQADTFATIERGAPGATPWISEDDDDEAQSTARLADIELPDFGMPATEPMLPPSIYADRLERLRAAHGRRAATTTSSCGPIGSTAPTSPTSPGSTHGSRRRCSSSAPSGDPALLVGNECYASAEAAPLPMRCVRFQDFSLPGQPRDSSRPLSEILGAEGITAGTRVGVVGWKTYASREMIEPRRSSSTSSAGRPADTDSWRTPPTCSSTLPTGCASSTRSSSWQRSSGRPARRRGVRQPARRPPAGHDRAGGGPVARVERRAAVVPPHAHGRTAGEVRPAQPGRPADRAGRPVDDRVRDLGSAQLPRRFRRRGRVGAPRRRPPTTSSGWSARTSRRWPSGTRRCTSARWAARCRRSSTAVSVTRSSASRSTPATSSTSTSG